MYFANHSEKIKENEKIDKYLYLAREPKRKLWNLKVTVMSIVYGVLGTVAKKLMQRPEAWKSTNYDHPN